ncbi:MarR family winged helix-turn-helix transcriptional regulator [Chelativorans alearense]|uniref:MarR family winged helix-turn-helix transcriptional regulator n=1 Tax=Chelativorans alearense TaxID=2681495 RepID=UPI0013D79BD8|nr:MarR family transcriptional regulator [Chelativorans alearense]
MATVRLNLKRERSVDMEEVNGRIHPPIHTILDALSFRLARLVAVNERNGAARFRNAYGVSLNEWRVLGLAHALAPATVSEIRKVLLMDKGQLSRTIRQLVDAGLITTRTAPSDSRSVEVLLTDAGRDLHDRILEFSRERNEAVVATLTSRECSELMRLIQKITAHNEELSRLAGWLE